MANSAKGEEDVAFGTAERQNVAFVGQKLLMSKHLAATCEG